MMGISRIDCSSNSLNRIAVGACKLSTDMPDSLLVVAHEKSRTLVI